jgi:Ca2+-transporting ATPase
MQRPPRPPREPVINRPMWVGIAIQTLAIAGVTLTAYAIGLRTHPESPVYAETMSFVTLSASELLRAFTARSERYPLLRIGVFSNRAMVFAVAASLVLLLSVVYVPFLQSVFDTVPLTWAQWELVLPLLAVPAIVAEVTKWVWTGLDRRRATA